MINRGFDILIHYSPEDHCYLAYAPDLPGCVADGQSVSEAADAISEEIDLWISVNQERGVSIPKPRLRPDHVLA